MEALVSIIAILSSVTLPIGLGMYIAIRSRNIKHKERMELIRQGIIPPDESKSKTIPNKFRSLRNGILLVGIAIGLIISLSISYYNGFEEDEAFFVVAPAVLLFLGLGYLLFYLLVRNKKEFKDDSE